MNIAVAKLSDLLLQAECNQQQDFKNIQTEKVYVSNYEDIFRFTLDIERNNIID